MPQSLAQHAHAPEPALPHGRRVDDRLPVWAAVPVILALSAVGWVLVIHAARLAAGMLG